MSLGAISQVAQVRETIVTRLSEAPVGIGRPEAQGSTLGKLSIFSQRLRDDARKLRKPKPWEERTLHSSTAGSKIRTKLPGIDSYDRDLEYHHVAMPKVMLRLERVIGTDRLRINDQKFMTNLSKKIEDEERRIWKRRVKVRQNSEDGRYRQLVIDGIMEPDQSEGMQKLRTHPIFRVNRMMARINKLSYNSVVIATPPPITPTEPFEDQKQTGYLFGSHKNHYLKLPQHQEDGATSKKDSTEEPVDKPEPVIRSSIKAFSALRVKSASQLDFNFDELEEEKDDEEEGEEDLAGPSITKLSRTEALVDYLRRESLTQARRYLGVDEDDVKKKFEIKPPPIVEAVYEEKETSDNMFVYAADLLKTYEREQMKTDEFCTALRKRFN